MFVQVIRGRVRDREGLKREWERWDRELKPGAAGVLGSTGGVTDDGQFIGWARFASEADARRNSDRPEQGEWWKEFSSHFDGEATFLESDDVDSYGGGGSDKAGFVQFMVGRVKDIAAGKKFAASMDEMMSNERPDVLGATTVWLPDGRYVDGIYFRSEAEAREGEKKEPPPEAQEGMSLFQIEEYLDIKDPWMR